MASGMSRRFGSNKLMASFQGKPLIARALEATDGLFHSRVAVTRHEDIALFCREKGVLAILHDLPHRSDTVRLGMEAIGSVDSCLFLAGDQPLLRKETVAALLHCAKEDREAIWRPAHKGTPGAPVLFPRWTFPALRALPEGKGGGYVIQLHPDRVKVMNVDDPYELMDADTPAELAALQSKP